jgi:hypothetical protein
MERTPLEDREVERFRVKRTILGPPAVTTYLRETGEVSHALPPDVLSPVPWQFVSTLFNPFGGAEGWITTATRAVHLWAHALGPHRKLAPHPHSFIAQALIRHGVDFDDVS